MNQEKSQLKFGIILNYINMFVSSLIPIFYTPIMLSLLGQNEYGLYKLSSSVTSYLSLISLGIGSAVTRYLIKAKTEEGKESEENFLGLFMVIFQIIAVVSFVVGVILVFNLGIWYGNSLTSTELGRMKILTFILVCNTALSFSMSPYISVVSAHERFIFLQCMNIISTCIAPLLNLIVLFLGYASIGMAVSSLVLGIVGRFIYWEYVRKIMELKPRYKNMPIHLLKEILSFSFWIFVANVVGQLYNATDTVMIGAVPGLATVGVAVYNIGGTFSSIVFSLTTGISSLLGPKTNKLVFEGASNSTLTDLTIRVGRLQGYIITLIVTGFIAFGQPFISFYAGEGYKDAYWVAVLMMVPNMIPLVQSVCLSVIVAKNKHRFRSIVYLIIAIINVIGTWVLMQTSLGIIGAALMTGIATIIGQGFMMNWYYWKRTGLEMGRFWKELSHIYILPVCMCVLAILLGKWIDYYKLVNLLVGIVVYTIIYCIGSWIWVMNPYEKSLVREPILKIINRRNKRNGL
jgi:O-antigen/teichoic acid export membrane protein